MMVKNKTRSRTLAALGLAIALTLLGIPALPPSALQAAHAAVAEGSVNGLPGAQFVHVATPESINGHWSVLSHPLIDGNPTAIVFVTPNWNPGSGSGEYNNHPIGVYYVPGIERWSVLNEDFGAIQEGAAFNVLIPKVDSSVDQHTATTGNTSGHLTYIDNPLTNGKPKAVLHLTEDWNPGGGGGTYNNH